MPLGGFGGFSVRVDGANGNCPMSSLPGSGSGAAFSQLPESTCVCARGSMGDEDVLVFYRRQVTGQQGLLCVSQLAFPVGD